jgi:hypothetical protein
LCKQRGCHKEERDGKWEFPRTRHFLLRHDSPLRRRGSPRGAAAPRPAVLLRFRNVKNPVSLKPESAPFPLSRCAAEIEESLLFGVGG